MIDKKQTFSSDKVWKPQGRGFSMGVVQPEGKTIYLTGQVAWDAHSQIVGVNDVNAQTHQCFRNIECLLRKVGGTLSDIVNLTTYFLQLEHLPIIQQVRNQYFLEPGPTSTSVKVAGLGHEQFLVELTPIVVIPLDRFNPPQ